MDDQPQSPMEELLVEIRKVRTDLEAKIDAAQRSIRALEHSAARLVKEAEDEHRAK